MNTDGTRLERAFGSLRWSMATQISLSIAVISTVLIGISGITLERLVVSQLRSENESILISNLAFINDELAVDGVASGGIDRTVVSRIEDRMHRLRAALFDENGRMLTTSASFPFTDVSSNTIVDVAALSRDIRMSPVTDAVRERYAPFTRIAFAADGRRFRTLVGRVSPPRTGPAPDPTHPTLLVALAVETISMPLVLRDRYGLLVALAVALSIAVVLGTVIAGRIVAGARRLGAASSRIGAEALDERLSLESIPLELVESATAFNHMLDRLQASFGRLAAFSSDIAHDLRTPINNLLGEAQVALSRPRSQDEYRAVIESSVEEYERLSRMIGNMLFLARADNAEAVVVPTRLQASDVLDRVHSYFELIAEERGIRLERTVGGASDRGCEVLADEDMLVRALSNLVSNALRHASPGTAVSIMAGPDAAGGCVIAVSNEGPPIAPGNQTRIFERFYRGNPAREDSSNSSGLGLAIVHSIMRLHRGAVTVSSAPGARTVFTLAFPAAKTIRSTGG